MTGPYERQPPHMTWVASQTRDGGLITRTWTDPCPVCGAEVTRADADAITVTDNPQALIPVRNPACQYDPGDPGNSPDCICTPLVNPAPDPMLDEVLITGWKYTLKPCGHRTGGTMRFYQQTTPAPGTLGELIADWAATGGDDL